MKKLNKKGFTIMEVLTVIIVIAALMLITMPLINSISAKNKEELYHSYERMMEEYAVASSVKNKSKILLSELDGLDKIKNECTGYVNINKEDSISYKAYIKCGDKYTTEGYEEAPIMGTIKSCSGCKFMYTENEYWTTWNTNSRVPTEMTIGLYDSYLDVVANSGKKYFLGLKLNSNNQVTRAFACGIKDDKAFCIEGTKDGAMYNSNLTLLQSESLYNNTCIVQTKNAGTAYETVQTECGPFDGSNLISAHINTVGVAFVGNSKLHYCYAGSAGDFDCR